MGNEQSAPYTEVADSPQFTKTLMMPNLNEQVDKARANLQVAQGRQNKRADDVEALFSMAVGMLGGNSEGRVERTLTMLKLAAGDNTLEVLVSACLEARQQTSSLILAINDIHAQSPTIFNHVREGDADAATHQPHEDIVVRLLEIIAPVASTCQEMVYSDSEASKREALMQLDAGVLVECYRACASKQIQETLAHVLGREDTIDRVQQGLANFELLVRDLAQERWSSMSDVQKEQFVLEAKVHSMVDEIPRAPGSIAASAPPTFGY